MNFREKVSDWFIQLQSSICFELEKCDGKGLFETQSWDRPEGGGGKSRIITHGALIEKGGVNFSAVNGRLPVALEKSFGVQDTQFFATGISIVLHPGNPWTPIIHMNLRYFEMDGGKSWFGGGIDLTPHYIDKEDASYFHSQLKAVCDRFDPYYYPKFKKWADDYFYISHRQETRGIGGIFFDRLEASESNRDDLFKFVKSLGLSFSPVYIHFLKKYKESLFSEEEKKWQLVRRGRYVEFNLVYDAGTKFGLETNGRIESILMSLPPLAAWPESFQIKPGGKEAYTQQHLLKGLDWLK